MMVYNAIKGNYEVPTDGFYDLVFPYLFVSSTEDYAGYEKYFVETMPYTNDELVAISEMSYDDMEEVALNLSIADAEARSTNPIK